MRLEEFWAKTDPFQSVPTHALVSGYVAQSLFDEYLSADDQAILNEHFSLPEYSARDFVGYLTSLHDVGKLELNFQGKDRKILERIRASVDSEHEFRSGIRHEKTGQKSLYCIWDDLGQDRRTKRLASKVVGAHHQGKSGPGHFQRDTVWHHYQMELEEKMRACFLHQTVLSLPAGNRQGESPAMALLLGAMILADWISSGKPFEDAEDWIKTEGAMEHIRDRMDQFLKGSGLLPGKVSWPLEFSHMWQSIPADGLRPVQRRIEELFQEREDPFDLILIEAPMGEGKTEAGVYAALQMAERAGKNGLYMALPTAATSNQMVFRLRELVETHNEEKEVRLLHSMSWLVDSAPSNSEDEADEIAKWLVPTKRGLLGQYAVGTVDQAMLAATKVRYGVLRLLGLSNKALIIDEIHTYDAYMAEILVDLLKWCRALHIPVVMLSATLSPGAKRKLLGPYSSTVFSTAYPLVTVVTRGDEVLECPVPQVSHRLEATVQLKPLLEDPEGIADLAAEQVKDGGCLCVLMNTVREAQKVFLALKKRCSGDLLLFHAQFPAGQRAEIEADCLRKYGKDKRNRPKKSILVCTQVVEQSLDVDFDAMITAVAPIDLILQRLGRVYRHGDTPRPPQLSGASLVILVPEAGKDFGPSGFVYPDCYLRRTVDLLGEKKRIRVPEDLAELVREGYDDAAVPEGERNRWLENKIEDQVKAGASGQYRLGAPDKILGYLEDDFLYEDEDSSSLAVHTRLGEPAERIALLEPALYDQVLRLVVTKNGEAWAPVTQKDLAEQVMRQSVSIRKKRLQGFESGLSYIKGDRLLSGVRIYPAEQGVCRGRDGKLLCFDPELGLLLKEGET